MNQKSTNKHGSYNPK